VISGTYPIFIVQSLKGVNALAYCWLTAPIALIMKKYSQKKVGQVMKTYQPFKAP
jgi:hypothetical protein